jgi:hypothetical protein
MLDKLTDTQKWILGIVAIVSTISLTAQAQKPEAWKTVGIYSSSILLNAVGEGLNDSGQKGWGHTCNAMSIGILVISPALMNYEKKKWGWYIASYVGLRIGMFDYAYNMTRQLPVNQIGGTSWWDQGLQKLNPPNTYLGRIVFFTFGFSVPFNIINK